MTPKGCYYSDEVEYVVIDGDNGQIALMSNHSPIVVGISNGFVKRVQGEAEYFYVLSEGIVEYNANLINIIAQEIAEGDTLEDTQKAFQEARAKTASENKRKLMDFTELEKELAKTIKEIKVSQL